MCFNCNPQRFNPGGCQDRFDPCPEGSEIQRMEPQVERLVIQAENLGRVRTELSFVRQEAAKVAPLEEELEKVKRWYRDEGARRSQAESKVYRLENKIKKATKKGKK